MSDYINRADAIEKINTALKRVFIDEVGRDILASIPPADVVCVVRCADCKCWTEWANGTGSCSRFALDWIGTDADDFCSMGERKNNG